MTKQRIAVLFNQDYAPEETDYVARADVEKTAHAVTAAIGAATDFEAELVAAVGNDLSWTDTLRTFAPHAVFNLCESLGGNSTHESLVPGLLELSGFRYTGSNALTLATALRKDLTKELLMSRSVPTPESIVVSKPLRSKLPFPYPAIVKPLSQDGSLGIHAGSVVANARQLNAQVQRLIENYKKPVLVERFIEGREINVPILGNDRPEVLPVSEIEFIDMPGGAPSILTYRGKWEEDSDEYRATHANAAPYMKPALLKRIHVVAQAAYEALECRGYARVDLRVDEGGIPWVIDVNPNCDLSPRGGFFRSCRAAQMDYADMVLRIVRLALEQPSTHLAGSRTTIEDKKTRKKNEDGANHSRTVPSRSRAA